MTLIRFNIFIIIFNTMMKMLSTFQEYGIYCHYLVDEHYESEWFLEDVVETKMVFLINLWKLLFLLLQVFLHHSDCTFYPYCYLDEWMSSKTNSHIMVVIQSSEISSWLSIAIYFSCVEQSSVSYFRYHRPCNPDLGVEKYNFIT